jgi:hypothetical protein
MVLEDLFAAFAERRERNAKAAIGGFGARDGLKKQINGSAAFHRGELRADVR